MKTKTILISVLSVMLLFSCTTAKLERVETKVEEIPVSPETTAPLAEEYYLAPLEEEVAVEEEEELPVLYSDGEFYDFKNGETPREEDSPSIAEERVEMESGTEATIGTAPTTENETSGEGDKDINKTIAYLILVVFLLISVFSLVSLLANGRRSKEKSGEDRE